MLSTTELEEELTALERAYASGATRVRFRDREVYYDSGDQLLKRINYLKRRLGGSSKKAGFASFSRGDC